MDPTMLIGTATGASVAITAGLTRMMVLVQRTKTDDDYTTMVVAGQDSLLRAKEKLSASRPEPEPDTFWYDVVGIPFDDWCAAGEGHGYLAPYTFPDGALAALIAKREAGGFPRPLQDRVEAARATRRPLPGPGETPEWVIVEVKSGYANVSVSGSPLWLNAGDTFSMRGAEYDALPRPTKLALRIISPEKPEPERDMGSYVAYPVVQDDEDEFTAYWARKDLYQHLLSRHMPIPYKLQQEFAVLPDESATTAVWVKWGHDHGIFTSHLSSKKQIMDVCRAQFEYEASTPAFQFIQPIGADKPVEVAPSRKNDLFSLPLWTKMIDHAEPCKHCNYTRSQH